MGSYDRFTCTNIFTWYVGLCWCIIWPSFLFDSFVKIRATCEKFLGKWFNALSKQKNCSCAYGLSSSQRGLVKCRNWPFLGILHRLRSKGVKSGVSQKEKIERKTLSLGQMIYIESAINRSVKNSPFESFCKGYSKAKGWKMADVGKWVVQGTESLIHAFEKLARVNDIRNSSDSLDSMPIFSPTNMVRDYLLEKLRMCK